MLIETGVAHGGSLVFYASLFRVLEKGRVIGIEVDLKPQNRDAIRAGQLASLITLIDGSSVESSTLAEVRAQIKAGETVMVVLDSNHTRDHVLGELRAYAPLVTPGSYIVVCDGIMQELVGAPRSSLDRGWNNPGSAVSDFLSESKDFALAEPSFPGSGTNCMPGTRPGMPITLCVVREAKRSSGGRANVRGARRTAPGRRSP